MVYKYDANKSKATFEKMFGSGSYESGLSSARNIGALKAQAGIAKKDYTARMKEAQKAAKKAAKEAAEYEMYGGQSKKSWEAGNKAQGKITAQQEKVQDMGRGGHLPTRNNQKKERKAIEASEKKYGSVSKGTLIPDFDKITPYAKAQRMKKEKEKKGVLGGIFDKLKKSEVGKSLKAAEDFFNPFDNVKAKDAVKNYINSDKSDTFKGVARGANRAVDSASLGIMSNLDKKVNNRTPSYTSQRKFGDGGGTDMLTSGLGYLVPGVGAYKALNATKAGKGLTQFGSQGIKQRIASEVAEGATIGAGMSGTEVGVREGLNPKDYNWKENLGYVGLNTAAGAVADPLLYGAGKGLGKLLKRNKPGTPATEELLGLPEPQLRLNEPQMRLSEPSPVKASLDTLNKAFKKPEGFTNPIPKNPSVINGAIRAEQFAQKGIGFGQGSKFAPKSRPLAPLESKLDARPQEYWQQRYEEFAKHVNESYDTNNQSPEALDELWSQFAKYDEPYKLEQVVDLAYPKGFEAPPKQLPEVVTPEAPLTTALKQDNRINELTKGLYPPKRPDTKVSRLATLDEMVQRLEGQVPAKTVNEPQPLPFMREQGFNPSKSVNITNRAGVGNYEAINSGSLQSGRDFEPIGQAPKGSNIPKQDPMTKPQDDHGYGLIDLEAEAKVPLASEEAMKGIKDISSFQVGTKNIYELADRLPKAQGDFIKSTLDTGKKNLVSHLEQITTDLSEKITKGLNIKKGSKESALVQDFGEKTLAKKFLKTKGIDASKLSNEELTAINIQQLKKLHPDKYRDIIKADRYFREKYNELIDQVNTVRTQIYPNQADRIVPKRDDYYHHFNELEGLDGLKNVFDSPASIDPHLEGVSSYTKPKTKFQGFMQKRGIGPYKSDAVGGYLKYVQASTHSIHIDPVIPVMRRVKNEIADATVDSKNANKVVQSLEMNANDLAGKTNDYDRVAQLALGRKGMKVANWANSRVKSNMILGNLSSALGQLGSVPLGVGKVKTSALPGLKDTLEQTVKSIFRGEKNAPVYQSNFLKERFKDKMFRQFDQKLIEQPKNMAVWLLETADKAGTKFMWNSMYNKGLKEKVADPIKYADYETRKLVAGRGVGEVPLLQKSKSMQVLAPFTLEVGNQWKVLREMVGEKDATGIITFLVASYGLNKVIEEVRGMGVSFDPIDALIDGYTRKDGDAASKTGNALASLTGEVVGNIPGGNLLTQMVDTDKKVPFTDLQYKELFGERNPNRFGTGLTVAKAFQDPSYLIAPFGAAQMKKTAKGIESIKDGGVYKDNPLIPFTGEKTELKYPVGKSPVKNLQQVAFGPSSVSEARDYYNNDRKPLTEKMTQGYQNSKSMGNEKEFYENLMRERRVGSFKDKIKEVQKDKELTQQEKMKEILRLMAEIEKLNN